MRTETIVFDYLEQVLNSGDTKDHSLQLERQSFYSRHNFILPRSDVNLRWAYLRFALKYCKRVLKASAFRNLGAGEYAYLHVHNSRQGTGTWASFLGRYGPQRPDISIIKDELIERSAATGRLQKLRYAFALFRMSRHLAGKGCSKLNALMLFDTFLFLCGLHDFVKSNRVHRAVFTGCYEPDSNLASGLLRKRNVPTDMAVSGSPLLWHLKQIVADRLFLTNPYQKEEVAAGVSSTTATEVLVLPSLQSESFLDKYRGERQKGKGIAVYTSGIWKRKAGGTFFDEGIGRAEEMIFHVLGRVLSDPTAEIRIYMHPHERRTLADYESAMTHYRNYFDTTERLHFAAMDSRTDQCFDEEDVAICTVSNIVTERLSVGCKVLLVYPGADFPLTTSGLNMICAKSETEIFSKLTTMLAQSEETYFSVNRLGAYRITAK